MKAAISPVTNSPVSRSSRTAWAVKKSCPGVAVELRTLTAAGGVLDGQRVQPQLVCDQLKLCHVGSTEIDPHYSRLVVEVLGHHAQGEVLVVKNPIAIAAVCTIS